MRILKLPKTYLFTYCVNIIIIYLAYEFIYISFSLVHKNLLCSHWKSYELSIYLRTLIVVYFLKFICILLIYFYFKYFI